LIYPIGLNFDLSISDENVIGTSEEIGQILAKREKFQV